MFEIAGQQNQEPAMGAKIKVIGVGGGGCNAVNNMIKTGLTGVEYIVVNTDAQALNINLAPTKIQLGQEITKGLGAGSNPDVGRKSALEDYEKLGEIIEGADMVFVTAGMGGGTGTGAAPVIAKLCKELGALTVGVVTKPFMFEGKRRQRQALEGITELEDNVDSLITIPNQRLLSIAGEGLSLVDTFKKADDVLLNAVQGISDLINNTGLINSDFADVSTVMANKGLALMGTGLCSGPDRAVKAATDAISSPLLEDVSINGATGIIINITGSSSLTAHETNEAVSLVMEAADEDAEIIFGTVIDEDLEEQVKVTVIATGLGDQRKRIAPVIKKASLSNLTASAPLVNPENTRPELIEDSEVGNSTPPNPSLSPLARSIQEVAGQYEQSQKKSPESQKVQDEKTPESTAPERPSFELNNRAKTIAEKLGFLNFDEDEFDSPTFLRKERSGEDPKDLA